VEYRRLGSTGMSVSALGFGASSLGGVFRRVDEGECIETVHVALEGGINFLDTSPYYGDTRSERVLGRALRGVPRERYHLATKVGQYGGEHFDFSAQRVLRSVDESMERLGVEFLDLVQCHDIEFADHDQLAGETLPALQELKAAGRIGAIGVTGLPLGIFPSILERVPPATVDTVLSFCHFELNDSTLLGCLPYLEDKGVGVINASPTGMGLLTERGAPEWHPASEAIRAGCRRAVELCRERGADIVALAVQYSLACPAIATTLISTANPENMRRNLDCAAGAADPELLEAVLAALAPIRDRNFTRGRPEHRDPLIGAE
jgi:L-galactose dehydrogenase